MLSFVVILTKFNEEQQALSLTNECNESPEAYALESAPRKFVPDTDSISCVMDTGANRFIVNDRKLLRKFRKCAGTVKEIGGKPTSLMGTGELVLKLKSDDGKTYELIVRNAVYVPTCPYNLIPPQILLGKMKNQGFKTRKFEHDNEEYVLKFKPPNEAQFRSITIPISSNGLFIYNINEGYTSFFKKAHIFNATWQAFAGAADVVPNDDEKSQPDERSPDGNPRERQVPQSTENPRELSQCHVIPHSEEDFEPIMQQP